MSMRPAAFRVRFGPMDEHAPRPLPAALPDGQSELQVLVLDDSEVDRMRIGRLLAQVDRPVRARYAASLKDFAAAIDVTPVDVAILDYSLPEGSGLDAVRLLRENPRSREARPIMIAGEARTDVAVAAMKEGSCDYLVKDELTADTLRHAIHEALASSPVSGSAEGAAAVADAVHRVMRAIDDVCFTELRPIASRILRQVRELRGQCARSAVSAETIAELDAGCLSLNEYLDGFGRAVAVRSRFMN
jgi:PleD family two-component response regulator